MDPQLEALPGVDASLFEGMLRLLEYSSDAFIVVGSNGVILRANRHAGPMFGYGPGELIGKSVDLLVPASVRERHPSIRERYMASPHSHGMGIAHEVMACRADGSEFPAEITLSPLNTPFDMVVLTSVRDVSARRSAEGRARELQHQLEAILENSSAVITVKDMNGRYKLINSRYEAVLHRPRAEVLGKTDEDLWPPDVAEQIRANDRHVVDSNRAFEFEQTIPQPDGLRTFLSAKFPLYDAGGAIRGVGMISTDITDRKKVEDMLARSRDELEQRVRERTAELDQAIHDLRREVETRRSTEQQLRDANAQLAETSRLLVQEQAKVMQAEKLSSIGLLASGVAHEINNPLGGVMGCLKALRDGSVSGDRRREYFDTANDGLERIRVIVRGLLDYARQRPPETVLVDLGDVIDSCLRLARPSFRGKDLEVEVSSPVPRVVVTADRTQLTQALMNVLLNSVHASPRGARISITAHSKGDSVDVRVEDQGTGIPREILGRVTDPFFTTKPEGEGTGLGLAVTLGVMKANGGDLNIESEVGRGTTVTLSLPCQASASPGSPSIGRIF